MMRRACFQIARAALFVVALYGLMAPVDVLTAGPIDTAAVAAAEASPELVGALSKEIGGTPEQAAGAAGALFGLAKSRLQPGDFAQIAKAVPGMDLLLKAAPSASAQSGQASDPLSQLAGTVGGIPAVAAQFSKLGLKPEMAPKAIAALTAFLTKSGGANLGSLLAGGLK
jgi:hypothetical protein